MAFIDGGHMNTPETNVTNPITKREYWAQHIKQWQESKLSQERYCENNQINYNTFVYWKGVLKGKSEKNSKKRFLPVEIKAQKDSIEDKPQAIQIKLQSGYVVFIPTTLSIKKIAKLIHLLGESYA